MLRLLAGLTAAACTVIFSVGCSTGVPLSSDDGLSNPSTKSSALASDQSKATPSETTGDRAKKPPGRKSFGNITLKSASAPDTFFDIILSCKSNKKPEVFFDIIYSCRKRPGRPKFGNITLKRIAEDGVDSFFDIILDCQPNKASVPVEDVFYDVILSCQQKGDAKGEVKGDASKKSAPDTFFDIILRSIQKGPDSFFDIILSKSKSTANPPDTFFDIILFRK